MDVVDDPGGISLLARAGHSHSGTLSAVGPLGGQRSQSGLSGEVRDSSHHLTTHVEAPPAQVVLVDDHPLVLFGMQAALRDSREFQVAALAQTGREALRVLETHRVDVVLLDLQLPDLSGIEVLVAIKQRFPGVRVVMVTSSPQPSQLLEALRAGADGFLDKEASRELLTHGLSVALAGGSVLSTPLLQACLAHWTAAAQPPEPPATDLKPREVEILRLVACGKSNRAIGEHLSLAEVTVKKYVQSILDKLGVNDRTQAAMKGVRLGLVQAG